MENVEKLFTRYKVYVDKSAIYGKDTSAYLKLVTDLYSEGISINRLYDLSKGLYWLEFDVSSPYLYSITIDKIKELIEST